MLYLSKDTFSMNIDFVTGYKILCNSKYLYLSKQQLILTTFSVLLSNLGEKTFMG